MIYRPLVVVSISTIFVLLVGTVTSQFSGCDYAEQMGVGSSRDLFSPNYPNPYRGQVNCRWQATAPVGTLLQLQCTVMNLPVSTNCAADRILVSREGRPALAGALAYCGTNGFTVESTSNRIVVAFRTPASSAGGRFLCRLSVQQPCQCGIRNFSSRAADTSGNATTRIVGGVETGVNEFPMMSALVNLRSRAVHCGATIISNRHALTAAHCFVGQSTSTIALLVGDHDLTTGSDTPYAAVYTLTRLLSHSAYRDAPSAPNDIGLVFTATTMTLNHGVGSACLPFPFTGNTFAGNQVEGIGWGSTSFGGPKSQRLQKVSLDVITNAACRRSFTTVQGSHICTFRMGKDMCQYDSGGPLLWTNPRSGLLYLVGLSSYGLYCAGSDPGVNTRVASYLPWIQQNTPGTQFCRPTVA